MNIYFGREKTKLGQPFQPWDKSRCAVVPTLVASLWESRRIWSVKWPTSALSRRISASCSSCFSLSSWFSAFSRSKTISNLASSVAWIWKSTQTVQLCGCWMTSLTLTAVVWTSGLARTTAGIRIRKSKIQHGVTAILLQKQHVDTGKLRFWMKWFLPGLWIKSVWLYTTTRRGWTIEWGLRSFRFRP